MWPFKKRFSEVKFTDVANVALCKKGKTFIVFLNNIVVNDSVTENIDKATEIFYKVCKNPRYYMGDKLETLSSAKIIL